jgi:pyridoxal phosphate enzyme (YggS family)
MENEQTGAIKHNIEVVLEKIQAAAVRAGRDPGEIALIAVTKKKSAAVIKTLLELGLTRIGESYLEEALFKMDLLAKYQAEWHLIGSIQPGKEKKIAMAFDQVHAVEKLDTALKLDKFSGEYGRKLPVYLELNVSGEITKHGWPAWDDQQVGTLLPKFEEVLGLPNLEVRGLMTMAPYATDPQEARPYFKRLRKIRDLLAQEFPRSAAHGLSMGMSGDFEVAIEEGATILRIGSALVGQR